MEKTVYNYSEMGRGLTENETGWEALLVEKLTGIIWNTLRGTSAIPRKYVRS